MKLVHQWKVDDTINGTIREYRLVEVADSYILERVEPDAMGMPGWGRIYAVGRKQYGEVGTILVTAILQLK